METMVKQVPFGRTGDGREIILYRICHESGTYVEVLNYGCALRGMGVFEREHKARDVIAVPQDAAAYVSGDIPGGIRITGTAPEDIKRLEHSIWQVHEIGSNSIILWAEAEECGFGAAVKIRLMDHQRLVLDYTVSSEKEMECGITHSVPFCLCQLVQQRQQKVRIFCSACANAETLGESGYSNTAYTEIVEMTDVQFVSEGGRIHPMAELLAEETELALSVYSTMPNLRLRTVDLPVCGVELTALASEKAPGGRGAKWTERTVFGVDLMYRPDAETGSPFGLSMK